MKKQQDKARDTLHIRCLSSEKARWSALAKVRGTSLSTMVRDMLNRASREIEVDG